MCKQFSIFKATVVVAQEIWFRVSDIVYSTVQIATL